MSKISKDLKKIHMNKKYSAVLNRMFSIAETQMAEKQILNNPQKANQNYTGILFYI